ncbi:MAG TPA: hypothetical protein VGI48_15125 [Caldimonas sp.]
MSLAPGSAPWLLRHELRLAWRSTRGAPLRVFLALSGLLWLIYHGAAWAMLHLFGALTVPATFVAVGAGVWIAITLMLSRAITRSVDVFFERDDLDLLLASPIAPRRVFLVRGLGVVLAVVALYAWFLTPFAHVGLFTGHARLLAIYPALVGLGLLAAAAGMGLTAALVRMLGARRTRVTAQLLGAFVGALVFIVFQVSNLVSPARTARWREALRRIADDGGPFDRDSIVWLPLNALLGQPGALAVLVVAGVGAFAFVTASMSRHFLAGTQESMATPTRRRTAQRAPRFRAGLWRNVMVKEWKLIARDPQMIAHTLLQSIYMLPLVFVWLRSDSPQAVLAPTMVLLCATLASGLAWLTVAAEDAPELLASAPVDRGLLRRAKLFAALVPVWMIALPLALVLARFDPAAAAIFAACVVGATVSTGSLQIALPRPGHRRDLRRRGKGNLLTSVLEAVTTLAWPALAWSLLSAPVFAALPAVIALAAPAAAWWWGRQARQDFGAA